MKTCALLVALLLSLILSGRTLAQRYVVGVEQLDYTPIFNYQNGEYSAYGRELLDAFAEASGHTLIYRAYPVEELTKRFLAGEVDLKFPDHPRWKAAIRRSYPIVYSFPALAHIDGIMLLPENQGIGIDKFRSLATVRGFAPGPYLGLIETNHIRLVETDGPSQLLELVLNREVQGAYLNIFIARHTLQQMGEPVTRLVFDDKLPHVKSSYLLSSIRYPRLIEEFNQFLQTHRELVLQLRIKHGLFQELAPRR